MTSLGSGGERRAAFGAVGVRQLVLLTPGIVFLAVPLILVSLHVYQAASLLRVGAWGCVVLGLVGSGYRFPTGALLALIPATVLLPYFRFRSAPGKWLVLLVVVSVMLGVVVRRGPEILGRLRADLNPVARAVATWAAVAAVGATLALLYYSPALHHWLSSVGADALSRLDDPGIAGQTSTPIFRLFGFLVGPVFGVLLLASVTPGSSDARRLERLALRALIVTGLLSLSVTLGQLTIPGFILPPLELYRAGAGFYHNPVAQALLMTLLLPVCLGATLSKETPGWLRACAAVSLVLVVGLAVPLEQRSAQAGPLAGVALFTGSLWLASQGEWNRRTVLRGLAVVATIAIVGAVALGLVSGSTDQWGDLWDGIRSDPLSFSWFGAGVRAELNRLGFYMVRDRPIAGMGLTGFEANTVAYYDRYGVVDQRWLHALMHHPLHVLVDLGVLGLAAHAWMLAALLLQPLRVVFRGRRTRQEAIRIAAPLASGGAFLVLSVWTGEAMYAASSSVLLFTVLALAYLVGVEDRRGTGFGDRSSRGPGSWVPVVYPALYLIAGLAGL